MVQNGVIKMVEANKYLVPFRRRLDNSQRRAAYFSWHLNQCWPQENDAMNHKRIVFLQCENCKIKGGPFAMASQLIL